MTEVNGVMLPFLPAGGVGELKRQGNKFPTGNGSEFDKVLAGELSNIKFSSHAKARINSRDIDLSEADLLRLEDAVDKASSKGANESLIMMDSKAFIVSIKNRTVITLLSRNQLEENVVTNIDSAVFA